MWFAALEMILSWRLECWKNMVFKVLGISLVAITDGLPM
jgi:hypothetical protein